MAKQKRTREDLIAEVQRLAAAHPEGKRPKYREFANATKGNEYWLGKTFVQYTNLLEAAGFGDGNSTSFKDDKPLITPPVLPEDDIPIEETIENLTKRFQKRFDHAEAQKWMPFKVNSNDPIGINWFGDPHIDDNGCNWPLLREHINIIKKTPGMYGANIGDTHNNWVGRLGVLYAHQDTSRDTAFKLAKWFIEDAGIEWLIWLLGNHDAWNFGAEVMSEITHKIPMKDWAAQFKLVFPNKREVLIDAAHNHKGHSQWNPLHGQGKASVMGGIADLYIAGHLHNWALASNECPHTGRVYHLARCRGYKHIDDYAEKGGFGNQKHGSSIVSIIDPQASEVNKVKLFACTGEGAEYLTYLRKKRGSPKSK